MKIPLILLLTFFSTSLNALPVKTDHLYSNNDYKNVVTNTSFKSTGRFGNNSYWGSYELGAGKSWSSQKKQFHWAKNCAQYFSMEYNSSANMITYTAGSTSLNYTLTDGFTDIFIKTRAAKKGSWITIDNLLLNGETIADYSYADYYGDKEDYLHIASPVLRDNFILEGYSTMYWLNNKLPTNSRLSYEMTLVSVIDSYGWTGDDKKYRAPIPEPMTFVLFILSILPCLKKIIRSNQKPE